MIHKKVARVRGLDSFARLRNLVARHGAVVDLEGTLVALSGALGTAHDGAVQIVVGSGDQKRSWVLERNKARQGNVPQPRLEIRLTSGAAERVFSGEESPIVALARGELRLRGDVEFAKAMYRTLAAGEGRIDPCHEEDDAWRARK
jgi:hypothetical protein